jgi:sugar (pentulose or hexulose) kinase
MTPPTRVAVLDVGKTNVKVALVDLCEGREVAVRTAPNRVLAGPPWPHFDTEAIWDFACAAFREVASGAEAVAVTTHGACGAFLAEDGTLAAPVVDYEHPGLDALAADYDRLRPSFVETGSPRLALGLNLGVQFHWMLAEDPCLAARVAHVVTWPQYWGHRLTGALACDLSSLGCHSDLWNPHAGTYSSLVERLGLEGKMAAPHRPRDLLGHVTARAAAATGLAEGLPVAVGIHDSNASLLPHLLGRDPPFAVVSTGTWVIVMAVGGRPVVLDPARDTLINVNALGQPVPSARFMGGREYELAMAGHAAEAGPSDVATVLRRGAMLLPALVPGFGPFPGAHAEWSADPEGLAPGERRWSTTRADGVARVTGPRPGKRRETP